MIVDSTSLDFWMELAILGDENKVHFVIVIVEWRWHSFLPPADRSRIMDAAADTDASEDEIERERERGRERERERARERGGN